MPVGLFVLSVSESSNEDEAMRQSRVANEVVQMVREQIGPVASFGMKQLSHISALPKTRSGKVLRNVIRAIASDKPYNLPGTIEDVAPVEYVKSTLQSLGYPAN